MKQRKTPPDLLKKLMTRTTEPEKTSAAAPPVAVIDNDEADISNADLLANTTAHLAGINIEVDLACKISDTLVFFGWAQDHEMPITSVKLGGVGDEHVTQLHRFHRPELSAKLDAHSTGRNSGFILLLNVPKPGGTGTLHFECAGVKKVVSYKLDQELKNNPTFNACFSELLHVAEEQGFDNIYGLLSKYAVPATETSVRAAFDYFYLLPNGVLFASGWAFSGKADIKSIEARIDNVKYDLYAAATLIPREDLRSGFSEIGNKYKKAGFVGAVKTKLKTLPEKISFRVKASNRETLTIEATPKRLGDLQEFSRIVLSYLDISKDGFKEMLDQHLGQTLKIGLADPDKAQFQLKQQQFGTPPSQPKVTVIVPLYGRVDFLKYQLSQFADDPEFKKDIELIYVLDDPRLDSMFFRFCADWAPLFQVPFKAVTYGMNLGYAGANNVAAGLATTPHLLLLNSDVMPESSGWVGKLLKAYAALDDAGAVAPKLLYEDHSIQHAGMVFERLSAIDNMWGNMHPGKGMPDTEPVSDKPAEVPAVTGACLMISKKLYDQVGGLDEHYYLGDFEDSDLCLKLIELGKKNYYISNLTLYHLERQSQSLFENNDWKTKVTVYNSWQHNQRWDALITKLSGINNG